jgi:hypothetical protein
MGANAQITVPTFTAGEVLTAAQQNQSARTGVPVFATTVTRDAAFGGTGEKTLAEGQLCYVESVGLQSYNGSAWVTWGLTPAIIQTQSTTKTDTFTTTSSSYTDITGLSVSITPKSASNKILVLFSVNGAGTAGQTQAPVQLVRDTTAIAIGDTAGSRIRATLSLNALSEANAISNGSMNFVDSPATTSATTYKLQIRSFGGQTVVVNRSESDTDANTRMRTVSSITVIEVAP